MNVLFVEANKGTFVLRIDDTDLERSTAEYEQGIRDDLAWLGVSWGKTFKQSDRFAMYEAAADKLRKDGLLYACYETSEELDRQRKLLRVAGKPPIYNRAGLDLTEDQKAAYEAEGRKPHWRFKLSGGTVTWNDSCHELRCTNRNFPCIINALTRFCSHAIIGRRGRKIAFETSWLALHDGTTSARN